jgi:hypothetical protein
MESSSSTCCRLATSQSYPDASSVLADSNLLGRLVETFVVSQLRVEADRWLRDAMGERFLMGAVLHTGRRVFRLDDRILAVPIAALWG